MNQVVRGMAGSSGRPTSWYVVRSDDKRRARLNVIHHLLSRIPYKDATHNGKRPKLPERQKPDEYVDPDYPFKYVPERY